ncbi:MAG TPA: ABC transporter substrate-binding protein, partial [Brevibacillus sp.]|nr:ABC transporter substrate-binding protein [Brevibacillus sp.]
MMKWRSLASIGIGMALLLAACSSNTSVSENNSSTPQQPAAATEGGTLVVAAPVEPDTLDSQKSTWLDNTNSQTYDSFLSRDMQGKLVPHLAESWEVSDDGKVWTLKLRQDVKFHSGAPLT